MIKYRTEKLKEHVEFEMYVNQDKIEYYESMLDYHEYDLYTILHLQINKLIYGDSDYLVMKDCYVNNIKIKIDGLFLIISFDFEFSEFYYIEKKLRNIFYYTDINDILDDKRFKLINDYEGIKMKIYDKFRKK